MNSSRTCPVCGTRLPGDAPRGLCPQCLLGQVIGIQSEDGAHGVTRPIPSTIRYFGDYELMGEIAQGGMGVVYYALQISLNRTVALKMIRSGLLATTVEVQRFRAEAEAAANLDHPNIVPIYEIGEHEGQQYFSMKLMEGGTLADLNADCGVRNVEWLRRAANLVATVARAVHHAHQRGVLHRDIKPTNILLDDRGEPHLTDFGLAKLVRGKPELTQSLAVLGTPGYMSPEQAAGRTKQLTIATDIYSVGAILYELVSGQPPFKGDSTLEVLNQVQAKEPERPRNLNPLLDRDLETICLKCLEKDPHRRYSTAETLAQDLERWLAGEPIQARPVNSWERTVKWMRRNPVVAGLSAAAVLIFFAGLAGVLWQWRSAKTHAIRAEKNAVRADANAHESNNRLVRSYIANGNRLVDEGNPFTAMLWFAEALHLDEGNPAQEINHRLRLATLLREAPKLVQVFAHGGALTSAAFSRDGKRIVTTGRDHNVIVWDAETGKNILGPLHHPHLVTRASFIENDQTLLTASWADDGARMWNLHDGKVRTFFPHNGMRWATLSDDGKWLLTWGGLDRDIKLWNAATAELHPSIVQHGMVTRMAVFSPDGKRIATASTDRNVILWDRETMKPLFPPIEQDGEVRSLAFNANGTHLFAGNWQGSIRVWDTGTGKEAMPALQHKGLSTSSALAMSPGGKWLASLGLEGTVKIWNPDSGQLALPELRHSSAPVHMAFDSEGGRLVVGCTDGTAYLWDLSHDEPTSVQLKQSRKVYWVSYSPDGQRALTASSDGTVRLWDMTAGALTFSPWTEPPAAVLNVGNGNRLLTQDTNGSLQLWDAKTWKPVSPVIAANNKVAEAWLSRDENRLLGLFVNRANDFSDLEFKTWEPVSGRQISSITARVDSKFSVWVSPNCELVAITQTNHLTLHRATTNTPLWKQSLNTDAIRYVEFNPSATRAAVLTRTEAHVYDTMMGKDIFTPLKLPVIGICAAFSPDGNLLATACGDEFVLNREARIWDAESGKAITPAMEHNGVIQSIAFSPDGQRVVTASHDRTARIWDSRTGKNVVPPLKHSAGISSASFSADGRWIATFGEDGAARIWDAQLGEPLTPPLKSSRGLTAGCFLADGKYLFTECGSDSVTLWELPRDARPVEDWAAMASLLAAHRINPTGFVEPATESSNETWNALYAKHTEDFRPARGFIALKTSVKVSLPPNTLRPIPVR